MNIDQEAQDQYVLTRARLWTPDLDKLLRKWKKQVGKKERGHRELARKYSRRHYMFGLPAVVLSTLITAGAFATFQECGECDDKQSSQCQAEVWVRLAVGILGIISIGLTSSVTFLNYQQTAENHKSAADMFGERFREIDSMLQIPGPLRGDPITTLQSIRSQYDNDVRNAPVLPKKYDLELTYDVIASTPPTPGQVNVVIDREQKRKDTVALEKLLEDGEGKKKSEESLDGGSSDESITISVDEALKERNEHDTDDDQEVCIAFDLDAVPNYTQATTALAVATLAAKKREEEQKSLQKALAFELQRMEASTHRLQGDPDVSKFRKKVKRKKEKSNSRDPDVKDGQSEEGQNLQESTSSTEKETV
jgi:hypothetical protein